LTAAAVATQSESARHYAVGHPTIALAFVIAPPLLTALASKFRKASTTPPPPPSAPAPTDTTPR
jgi:hypothetical protein